MSIILALLVGTAVAALLSALSVKALLTLVPLNHKRLPAQNSEVSEAPAE